MQIGTVYRLCDALGVDCRHFRELLTTPATPDATTPVVKQKASKKTRPEK